MLYYHINKVEYPMHTLDVYKAVYVKEAIETSDDAIRLWRAGRDFKIYRGPYTSCRDEARLREMGYRRVRIFFREWHGGHETVDIDI